MDEIHGRWRYIMLEHPVELILAAVTALVGMVSWAIRLEGRINLLDRVLLDHLAEKKAVMTDLNAHLHRLEDKIDKIAIRCAAFSSLHAHYRHDDVPSPPEGA